MIGDQLRSADLEVQGRFPDASNLTLLAHTPDGTRCIYKPISGERPLWDFPAGTLGRREVATCELAGLLGWADLVPMTVLREDGPLGPGMCQEYVPALDDPAVDLVPADRVPAGWLVVGYGEGDAGRQVALVHRDEPALRRLALLDAVANNADRKGGHILRAAAGIRGIDHGLTFHVEDKLRTVLWGFAGAEISPAERAALGALADGVSDGALSPWLARTEIAATFERLAGLLRAGTFPEPSAGWPRLPWPAL